MEDDLIYILILAWNNMEDTREAILSFQLSEYPNYRIAVINNGSTDGTVEMLVNDFPQIEIIHSKINLGVSGGYNLGIEHAIRKGAKYILIANNDIEVDRQMIRHLYNALRTSPNAGIAMPKIFHYYENRNRLWCTGAYWRKFPPTVKMRDYNKMDFRKRETIEPIEFAPSCVLLLTKEMVNKVGYFDTNYFFYFDDWDYSIRARLNNFTILFVPKAIMWHKISKSTQKGEKPDKWWEEMGWSAARYYFKYHSIVQTYLFFCWFFIRESLKGKPYRGFSFARGVKKYIQSIKIQ